MLHLFRTKKYKYFLLVLSILIMLTELSPLQGLSPASAADTQRTVYYGYDAANAVINYLKFSDVTGNLWSKEAIYEIGALGLLNGFKDANGRFGRTVPLTKEEAIAIAYRAAGREAEAQQLGTSINNARPQANRKSDPLEVLHDGFLQLAANEGLITAADLNDAFAADQSSLTNDSFRRKNPAQRQEMIFWLSKTLNISPASQQQEVYNYSDWRSVDPEKLPYVEAFLKQGIITGSNNRINPTQQISREQCAQIIKNAEQSVLQATGHVSVSGIVEDITVRNDYTGRTAVAGREIRITNSDGSLAAIQTASQSSSASGGRNEGTGAALAGPKRELVVYKNGVIGDSSRLAKGDRIRYITDSSNIVKYVEVISNTSDIRYAVVQVNYVDQANMLIDVIQMFETDFPDLGDVSADSSFSWSQASRTTYRISRDCKITVNGSASGLTGITDDATAILSIDSNNLVKEIKCVDLGINTEARRIVRGIVEESNPVLGYLTLFNEDGSGTSVSSVSLRTYNYADQNSTEVLRDHKSADIDSIQAGDTVYLKLDKNGYIESISAVSNYTVRYAKIISKMPAQIVVEYEDGTQQILDTDENLVVIKEKALTGLSALKDGDRVRLLINENRNSTDLKEITIEGDEYYISNIYKGKITKFDDISSKITVLGMQVFNKGSWELTDKKGFSTLQVAESFRIYANDKLIDTRDANKLLYGNEAYIAVEKTYGGVERAVVISYRDSLDTEAPTKADTIRSVVSGSNSFTTTNENKRVGYSESSIVVKYGRLVTGNSLSSNDRAYMTLNRKYSTGNYHASVVVVDEVQNQNTLAVYRGRISEIVESRSFTIESFSQLQGIDWSYYNTPKTFNITPDTRVLIDEGILNVRDFVGYGDESYLKRTVYVVADGTNAVLVSTAPYGAENIRGTVFSNDGGTIGIRKATAYNTSKLMWESCADGKIDILKNTIVLKNGVVIDPANIKKGDIIRVLKKDRSATGDAYIIIVE